MERWVTIFHNTRVLGILVITTTNRVTSVLLVRS